MLKMMTCSTFLLSAGTAAAQAILDEIPEGAIEGGKTAIDAFPEVADTVMGTLQMLSQSEHQLADDAECLSALQAVVNGGALIANLMPFSSVQTFEDERGPVARVRALVGGDKLHVETHCEGATLVSANLEWGAGSAEPSRYARGTIDASLGLLLLGAMNGFLADEQEQEVASASPRNENDAHDDDAGPEPRAPTDEPSSDERFQKTSEDLAAAVARAIAGKLEEAPEDVGEDGPELTEGERRNLRSAVERCWIGDPGSPAADVTVIVDMRMTRDAKPDASSIDLVASQGGDDAAGRIAFEAARRAILRCGAGGFPLPPDKYEHWAQLQMTFSPEGLRVR